MSVLVCENVSQRYGKREVLTEVSFEIDPGTVTGLAGPNGSGKTTLFRLLSGLARPTRGAIRIQATRTVQADTASPLVGVYLGVDNLHPGRTVQETLRLMAFLAQESRQRADERLAWAGLASVGRRRVGSLSLGMRVRLAIALATVSPSKILLLDEPMNGLDVEAIGWIKSVIREYAHSGGAVLISSHLLNELDALVDRALILSRGRLVKDVDLGRGRSLQRVRLRVDDNERLAEALRATPWGHCFAGSFWVIDAASDDVGRLAFRSGAAVLELVVERRETLEETFVAVASGEFRPPIVGSSS